MVYFLVFLFGVLVGASELISRHSDYRFLALITAPSLFYLCLNGALSIVALIVIQIIQPTWLGFVNGQPPTNIIWLVLTAGFGAAAFFRSSIFKLKTGNGDLSVGPAMVIDVLLDIIDEAVDRVIGERRLKEVSAIMAKVDFTKAALNLPTYSFASLKRLSPETQRQFAFQLKQLQDTGSLDPKVRSVSLGLSIMGLTGKSILKQAVEELGPSIQP